MPAPNLRYNPPAIETLVLAVLGLADLGFTVLLMQRGVATEANPVLRFYLQAGLVPFIGAKLLLTLGPLAALEFLRGRCARFVQSALRAGIALYLLSYGVGVCHLNAGHLLPVLP